MSFSWINPDHPFKIRMFPVAVGTNGAGNLEYLCESDNLNATDDNLCWRIRKMVYDSNGFQTHVYWANGDSKFDKSVTLRPSYTYS